MHHRLKRLPAVLAALALAGCSGDLLSPSGARRNVIPPAHDPVIFVHGWRGTASTWTTMIGRFKADGWTDAELSNFTYNSDLSNATTAKLLAARIDSVLAATGSTFLKSLNATDETPGTPRYAT